MFENFFIESSDFLKIKRIDIWQILHTEKKGVCDKLLFLFILSLRLKAEGKTHCDSERGEGEFGRGGCGVVWWEPFLSSSRTAGKFLLAGSILRPLFTLPDSQLRFHLTFSTFHEVNLSADREPDIVGSNRASSCRHVSSLRVFLKIKNR